MKDKIIYLIFSITSSAANFLISFLFLKYGSELDVAHYGFNLTLSLVGISFIRLILWTPILASDSNKKLFVPERFFAHTFSLFFLVFPIMFTIQGLAIKFTLVNAASLFSIFFYFYFIEFLRYSLVDSKYKVVLPIATSIYLGIILLLPFLFKDIFTILSVSVSAFIIGALALIFWFLALKLSIRKVVRALFKSPIPPLNMIKNGFLNSCSQIALVHLPFIIANYILSPSVVAILYLSRALFQPIQVLVRAFEVSDQFKIRSFKVSFAVYYKLLTRYFLMGTVIAVGVIILSETALPIFFKDKIFPNVYHLFSWAGIMIILSMTRVNEMVLYSLEKVRIVTHTYLFASIIAVLLFTLVAILGTSDYVSFAIFLGWVGLFLFQFFPVVGQIKKS